MQKLFYFAMAGTAAIGLVLAAPQPAYAAFLFICDSAACGSPDPNITFNVSDFEGGFTVNGATIQSGVGNPVSVAFDEGTAPTMISGAGVFIFNGTWLSSGATAPTSQTIFFINP